MLEISQAVGAFDPTDEEVDYTRDFLGALLIDLRGLVGFSTVLNELLQNAEDAKASEFHVDICDDALWIGNNSVFEDKHFLAITKIGSGSKRKDREQIGAFGLGFVSVYQLTDTPILTSQNQRLRFVPFKQKVYRRSVLPTDGRWATTFEMPWAFKPSELREALEVPVVDKAKLDDYLRDAQASLEEAGLFLNNVKTIRLYRNGHLTLEVNLKRGVTMDGCTPLTVQVNGKERLYEHRVMDVGATARAWLNRYGKERRFEVALIRPLGKEIKNFKGRIYAYLPTQSQTGLPFHINGDFYPTADRKDILWEGEHLSEWNKFLLETIAGSLEPVLTDLRAEGADDLYSFCAAVQGAKPSGDTLIPFTQRCWEACVSAFEAGAFFHTDQNTWANTNIAFRFEKHVPEAVRIVVRGATGWQFMPVAYSKYAKTLAALGANTLSLPNYLTALNVIFNKTPVWVRGDALENTALLTPFFELLNHFKSDLNESILEPLTKLHWGVAQDGSVNPLTELKRVTESEMPALHPWIIAGIQAHDGWLETLPTALAALIPELDLEATLEQIRETTAGEILEFHKAGWNCGDLYRFLALRQFTAVVADLPIFPSESYASFHTANEVVRSGDLTDPFNIRDMMDAELAEQHTDWLEAVGVTKLDHEEYFRRLLIEYFEGLQDDSSKRRVATFLVRNSPKINSQIVKSWQSVQITECEDGQWRTPTEVYLSNDLMNRLFGKVYPRLVKGYEDDDRARALFERFGVKREVKSSYIIDQLESLATKPVTSSSIRVRERVIKWLGGEQDQAVFARLSKIAWLPDLDQQGWFAPISVYPKSCIELMGLTPPIGTKFCGIEKLSDQFVKQLRMLYPTPALVVGHLENVIASKHQCSSKVYEYLEVLARTRTDVLRPFVSRLQQIACIPIGKHQWHPNSVFSRSHNLTPWRAVLTRPLQYPSLMKALGVREKPERDDFLRVLIEIAKGFDQMPLEKQKTAPETAKYCLRALAEAHSTEPNNRQWTEQLKAWRIVPLSGDTPAFVTPNRMYVRDVSEAFVKRYKLEPLESHFVPSIGEDEFWRDLGAKSLRESISITYIGGAGSQLIRGMTGKLRNLQSAILRVARAANKRDLDDLTTVFKQLEVHQDRRIIVRRIVLGRPVPFDETIEFDSAYDPASQRLLVTEETWDLCVNALADALDIQQGSDFGVLRMIVMKTSGLEEAMHELNQMGIPELPSRWKPAEALETTEIEVSESVEPASLTETNLDFLEDMLENQSEPDDQSARPAKSPSSQSNESSQVKQAWQHPRANSGSPASQNQRMSARETGLDRQDFIPDTVGSNQLEGASDSFPTSREQPFMASPDADYPDHQRSRPKPQRKFNTYVYLEPGEPDDNEDKEESLSHVTDRRGMEIVMAYETRHGRIPEDVSDNFGCGFDIKSTDSDGTIRFIELKTTNEPWGESGVTLSANQFQKALRDTMAERYWLYVVDDLRGQPKVHRICNPAGKTQHFVFDKGWLNFAEQSDP